MSIRITGSIEKLQKNVERYLNTETRLRTSDYKGVGRPRKTDYRTMKVKDIPDFRAWEVFNNGFKTTTYK